MLVPEDDTAESETLREIPWISEFINRNSDNSVAMATGSSSSSNNSEDWSKGLWHGSSPLLNPYVRTLFICLYTGVFIVTVTGKRVA